MPVGSRPPPMIAKMGPYTVFITPPPTPLEQTLKSGPMPVQPPPQRFHKAVQGGSVLGFFKNAATKVQSAHSSLDAHLARWLGLDQSKYQRVLEDYYESMKIDKGSPKVQEVSSK